MPDFEANPGAGCSPLAKNAPREVKGGRKVGIFFSAEEKSDFFSSPGIHFLYQIDNRSMIRSYSGFIYTWGVLYDANGMGPLWCQLTLVMMGSRI